MRFRFRVDQGANTQSMFAVIVGKKISSRATDRNRIKRRVYVALKNISGSFHTPVEALVFPKKEISKLKTQTIESELVFLFKKAGLIA